jgi:hypothetical protein
MPFDQPGNGYLPIVAAQHVADLAGNGTPGAGVLHDAQFIAIHMQIVLGVTGSLFAAYVPRVVEGVSNHHPVKGIPGCVQHPHVDLVSVPASDHCAIRTDSPVFFVGPYSLVDDDEIVGRRGR